ncbi:MAG: G5 domain-containing protein [Chloroflexi bacterium]|nr:G5 domain-containing protein [Chloroflexota bacterium]
MRIFPNSQASKLFNVIVGLVNSFRLSLHLALLGLTLIALWPPRLPWFSREDSLVFTNQQGVPIYVHENGLSVSLLTTKTTVAESLKNGDIDVHPGDVVHPKLEAKATAGTHVYIERAQDVLLEVDEQSLSLRTTQPSVDLVLAQQGVQLGPLDRVDPPLTSLIRGPTNIKVTRVSEEWIKEEAVIPHNTIYRADPQLELDQQQVQEVGQNGLRQWISHVTYEDGVETERTKIQEWVEKELTDTVIVYGTKIVNHPLDTPEGTVYYWRRLRVFATSYNASHGGKSKDDPRYGLTYLGLPAEKGIVAIDPTVIPFYTKMYIPGYGQGLAADTGGGIKGMRIDLAFGEDETNAWTARWVDIYLLTPSPSPERIPWIIPK